MHKLIIISLLFNVVVSYSQNVREVSKPEMSEYLDSLFSELRSKKDSGFYPAINILEKGLKYANTDYKIHKITFNLGALYTITGQFDKCIDMWLSMNNKGIYYDFQFGDNHFPYYLKAYKGNNRFLNFIQRNDSLRNKLSAESKAEYFVTLPPGYDKSVKYPLIIVLHGGIDNYYSTFENWHTERINNNFIAVYPQGRDIKGSFSRSYGKNGVDDITDIYYQVIKKYSVDTTAVVLAGQSAGGALSFELISGHIKARGLLLAFPVKPGDFNATGAQNLKSTSSRIYMICGELDRDFYQGQLELSNLLNDAKVENVVIKYPNLGHDFPSDFDIQIDKGLTFIMDNSKY